jgi:Tfp pilus assembly protein PilN
MCRGSIPFPSGTFVDVSQRHVSVPLRSWSGDPCVPLSLSCFGYGMQTVDVEKFSLNLHNTANQAGNITLINTPRSFSSLELMSLVVETQAAFSFATFKAGVAKAAAIKAAASKTVAVSKSTAENVALAVGTAAATWELC